MTDTLDQYRLLGRSGLRVSPLSLGTMTFGVPAAWGCDEEEAKRVSMAMQPTTVTGIFTAASAPDNRLPG